MRVLKAGDNMTGAWAGKFTCTGYGNGDDGCDAILEVNESDLYGTYMSSMGRYETHYITFMCPCCGAETDLANDDGYRHKDFPKRLRPGTLPHASTYQRKEAQRRLSNRESYIRPLDVDTSTNTSAN